MVNSLPNDEILGWSKLKAFADDKIHVTEKLKFVLAMVTSIFSFPTMFSKVFFLRVVNSRD